MVSGKEGTVVFTRLYESYLLRYIHFRQKQNNFEMKPARLVSDSQYASELKSDRSWNYFGQIFALFFPSNIFSTDDATTAVQLPHHSSFSTDPQGQAKTPIGER